MSTDGLKERLKAVMLKPENQVCCDCSERKPTWASLILPPPGAPPDSPTLGAFCCMNCSGVHRGLGTHICFVRSVTLDEWKEPEVVAMEIGGNANINAVFEAKDPKTSKPEPADELTFREKFVKKKYVKRQFYDASNYASLRKHTRESASTSRRPAKDGERSRVLRQASMPVLRRPTGVKSSEETVGAATLDGNGASHGFEADWSAFRSDPLSPIQQGQEKVKIKDDFAATWHPQSPEGQPKPRVAPQRGLPSRNSNSSRSARNIRDSNSGQRRRPRSKSGARRSFEKTEKSKSMSESDDDTSEDSVSLNDDNDAPGSSESAVNNASFQSSVRSGSDGSMDAGVVKSTSRYKRDRKRRGGRRTPRRGTTSPDAPGQSSDETEEMQSDAGVEGKLQLIAKLKETLQNNGKASEDILQQLMLELELAEKGLPDGQMDDKQSTHRSVDGCTSESKRKDPDMRRRGVRRGQSDMGPRLGSGHSKSRESRRKKATSPKPDERAGERKQQGESSKTSSRDGRTSSRRGENERSGSSRSGEVRRGHSSRDGTSKERTSKGESNGRSGRPEVRRIKSLDTTAKSHNSRPRSRSRSKPHRMTRTKSEKHMRVRPATNVTSAASRGKGDDESMASQMLSDAEPPQSNTRLPEPDLEDEDDDILDDDGDYPEVKRSFHASIDLSDVTFYT